jgi:hypothetical protein
MKKCKKPSRYFYNFTEKSPSIEATTRVIRLTAKEPLDQAKRENAKGTSTG